MPTKWARCPLRLGNRERSARGVRKFAPDWPGPVCASQRVVSTEAEWRAMRNVMMFSLGCRLIQADLALRIKCGQPRHDQRVVLEVERTAKAITTSQILLQVWGNPRDARTRVVTAWPP